VYITHVGLTIIHRNLTCLDLVIEDVGSVPDEHVFRGRQEFCERREDVHVLDGREKRDEVS